MRVLTTIFLLLFCITISGCRKSRLNRETSTSKDFLQQQFAWNDIFRESLGGSLLAEVDTNLAWLGCAAVSRDTLGDPYPISTTLDFGVLDCLGSDGRLRRGQLLIFRSAPLNQMNATLSISPENYFLSNQQIEGEMSIKFLGLRDGGETYEVAIVNGQISEAQNAIIVLDAIQLFHLIGGGETDFFTPNQGPFGVLGSDAQLDDVYDVTLIAEGINRDGRAYDVETESTLRYDLGCDYVTEGALKITPEALNSRKVTFGNTNCDNEVSVETENAIENIEIKG